MSVVYLHECRYMQPHMYMRTLAKGQYPVSSSVPPPPYFVGQRLSVNIKVTD